MGFFLSLQAFDIEGRSRLGRSAYGGRPNGRRHGRLLTRTSLVPSLFAFLDKVMKGTRSTTAITLKTVAKTLTTASKDIIPRITIIPFLTTDMAIPRIAPIGATETITRHQGEFQPEHWTSKMRLLGRYVDF